VYFNGSKKSQAIKPPTGNWKAAIINNRTTADHTSVELIEMSPYSCTVLYQ
jgi:hypothetical protein